MTVLFLCSVHRDRILPWISIASNLASHTKCLLFLVVIYYQQNIQNVLMFLGLRVNKLASNSQSFNHGEYPQQDPRRHVFP